MKVLVADKLSESGVDALAEHFDVDVRTDLEREKLLETVADYDAIVVRSATTLDAEVIEAATNLKVIARAGIGLDNVDVDAATARGVLVCNAPQSNIISAAEHTVAVMLALARHIPAADASLRQGRWERSALQGTELHGKTLGVLGLGRVGTLVAQRCAAFDMEIVGYDPFVSADRAQRLGVELVGDITELCRVADMLVVHLPLTPETTGLIGEAELQAMKPDARVINTARGGIVDEEALYTALSEGWIAGAALDVFTEEPMTDSKLFSLENIVVTPHLGASTSEAQDKAGRMVADAVRLALEGEVVPSAVNLQVGAGVPDAVKPFVGLSEKLGRLLTALHQGQASQLQCEYVGKIADEETQALTLSAIKGLLADVVHEPLTFVNAPLLAEERGLHVSTLTSRDSRDYVSLVRMRTGDVEVAATVVGANNRERLVRVWGFDIDAEPSDHMIFFRYADRPGIIGTIGNILGEADVNIAAMQVSRQNAGGEALIVMSVDTAIPSETVNALTEAISATEVRTLNLV